MVMAKYDSLTSSSHLYFYNAIAKPLSMICMHIAVSAIHNWTWKQVT